MIATSSTARCRTIFLDRPEARNALDLDGWYAFETALRDAEADPEIDVVLVVGTGGSFCAGQDVRELAGMSAAEFLASPAFVTLDLLLRFGKPLVMAVDGDAIGVGTTMLLHADFVVASPRARFRTPFVRLGATAEASASLLLPATVGVRVAARMLYLGDWVGADEAHRIGLVTQLADDPLEAARALCDRMTAGGSDSLQATRRLLCAARAESAAAASIRERAELRALLPDARPSHH